MKIKGRIIVTPLMSEMKEGQKGYLTTDAVIIINDNMVFFGTGYSISELKHEKYAIPITKTGPGKEDYEIDFHIACKFFNTKVNEEELKKLKENPNLIGPYPIETEIDEPLKYREQTYPRMDIEELFNSLSEINQLLTEVPGNETYTEDKKTLQKLIQEKLYELSLSVLELYEKTFAPLSDEESEEGRIINYIDDEKLQKFVHSRIKELRANQRLEEMSIADLEKAKQRATDESNFEVAAKIRDVIASKQQTVPKN